MAEHFATEPWVNDPWQHNFIAFTENEHGACSSLSRLQARIDVGKVVAQARRAINVELKQVI
jgi:hypothetical protein